MSNKLLKLYFTIISVFIFVTTNAQTKVIGYVIAENNAIPNVAVLFRSTTDSSIIYATLTGVYGGFHVDTVKLDSYLVEVRAIGFKPLFRSVAIIKEQKKTYLRTFKLQIDTLQLKGVEISAKKNDVQVFVDKTVFRPDSLNLKNSRTTLDVLNKVPEISVNKRSGKIKVMGNSNVLVLVNGANNKRNLKSINPNDIDRIELITNPSAKYRSDITSVINIVLKDKRKQGLFLSADASISVNKMDHFAFLQLTYTFKKMQFFVNYNGFANSTTSRDSSYLSILNYSDNTEQYSISNDKFNSKIQTIQYGVDIFPNKNNLICLTSNIMFNNYDGSWIKESNLMFNNIPETRNNNMADYENKMTSQNYSIYYKHDITKHNHFVWNTNIYLMNTNGYTIISDTSVDLSTKEITLSERLTEATSKRYSLNSKIYFSKKWTNMLSSDVGYQLFGSKLNSQSKSQEIFNYVNYTNLRNSIFSNIVFSSKKRVSGQLGLRIDNINYNIYDSIKNNYFTVIPSFSLLYKFNSKSNIHINYNKRLRFPYYYELNPFEKYSIDSVTNSSGNPNLIPETSHLFKAKYMYRTKGLYVFSELEYKYTNNIIVQKIQSDYNIIQSKFMNLGKANIFGLNIGMYTQLFKFIEVNSMLMLNYHLFPNRDSYNGWSYRAEIETVMPLPFGITMEASFAFLEKEILYNGISSSGAFIPEILLTLDVSDHATVGIGVNNPFFKIKEQDKEWTSTTINNSSSIESNSLAYVVYVSFNFNAGRKRRKINSTKKEIQLQMDKDNNNDN